MQIWLTVVPEPGEPGGPLAPPIFGRSINPIPTGEGRLSPPIYWHPQCFSPSGITVNVALSRKKYLCSAETCRWKMIGNESERKIYKLTFVATFGTSFITTFVAFPCTFGSFRFWILAHFDLTRFSKFFLKTRILVLVCFDFLFPFCATYIKVFTKPFQSTCVGFSSQFTSQCFSQNWFCKSVWMSSSDSIDWKCVFIKRTSVKFEYSRL